MQFEAKFYKNQRKRFAEVTGNFLSSLIKKIKKTKQKKTKTKTKQKKFLNLFQVNFPNLYPLKTSENLKL